MSAVEAGTIATESNGAPHLMVLTGVRRLYAMGDQEVTALAGIDLTVRQGEFVAIVGPSGSGKSTLLNILGCLDRPSEGGYRVAGRETGALDADGLAALRRHVFGFVFQGYNLLPRLTARANVELPALYAGTEREIRHARATALLIRLGLGERLGHRPPQLSGGQQQRVGIARALMNGGRVVLADEPTGALDSATGAEMLALFRTLCTEGHTVIIVSHDAGVAAQADRVIAMRDGRIVSDTTRTRQDSLPAVATEACSRGVLRQGLDAFTGALRTIGHNRLRNALTLLGIVVGICAVILAVDAGLGAQDKVLREMRSLGTNVTRILAGNPFKAAEKQTESLVSEDIVRIAALPFVAGVTPTIRKSVFLRHDGASVKGLVVGVSEDFSATLGLPVTEGRSFSKAEVETGEPRVVLTELARMALFPGGTNPIGAIVLVGPVPARVVGIATVRSGGEFGNEPEVLLPYTTLRARLGADSHFTALTLSLREGDRALRLGALNKLLSTWHGQPDFVLLDYEGYRQAALRTQATLGLLTTSLALISLLVGGIGVMNMMLVSVVERTAEIGILMAIGARGSDIRLQFLIEAVLLCLCGGVAGTALAYGVEVVASGFGLPFELAFHWEAAAIGIAASTLAGLAAGIVPAQRAAAIDPVEAINR